MLELKELFLKDLIKFWYKIGRCRYSKQAFKDDERRQFRGRFSSICTNHSEMSNQLALQIEK